MVEELLDQLKGNLHLVLLAPFSQQNAAQMAIKKVKDQTFMDTVNEAKSQHSMPSEVDTELVERNCSINSKETSILFFWLHSISLDLKLTSLRDIFPDKHTFQDRTTGDFEQVSCGDRSGQTYQIFYPLLIFCPDQYNG